MPIDDGSATPPGLRFNDIRDDYDDEFGIVRPPEEIARRWLLIPGIAYVLIGILTGLPAGFVLFWSLYQIIRVGFQREEWMRGVLLGIMACSLGAFLWSLLIFAGGISILRRTRYRLALVGTVAVIGLGLFGFYGGVLAYPFGVFALILLVGPGGRKLFGQTALEFTPELVRQRLRVPAIWMTRVSIVLISNALVGAIVLACFLYFHPTSRDERIALMVVLLTMPLVIALLIWIAITGLHMGKLQRRKSCLVAAYILTGCAIFPYGGTLIFPFGVWALVWLHHPDVRRFFDRSEITPGDPK